MAKESSGSERGSSSGLKLCIVFTIVGIIFIYFLNFDVNAISSYSSSYAGASSSASIFGINPINPSVNHTTTINASLNSTTSVTNATTTVYVLNKSSAKQAMNISLGIQNDELPGRYGYWALANYTRTVNGYLIANNTYYLLIIINGTWRTFAGALSPVNGTVEPMNGSGTFALSYVAIQNNELNQSAQLNGYIGAFNLNGTAQDILNDTYANQTGIGNNTFSWTARYFGFTGVPNIYSNYTAVFAYGSKTYMITINQTGEKITGDIVT